MERANTYLPDSGDSLRWRAKMAEPFSNFYLPNMLDTSSQDYDKKKKQIQIINEFRII